MTVTRPKNRPVVARRVSELARTPDPPYYVVVFTSKRAMQDGDGYGETAARMMELAVQREGFLGVESARDAEGFGITVSYWRDEASIEAWKHDLEHLKAQAAGKKRWYSEYALRVGKVERERGKAWK